MLTLEKINQEIQEYVERGSSRADIATLADLLICRDAMTAKRPTEIIKADGSEFAACINGKCFSEILPFLEELLETIKVLQPRLYDSFMQRLR